MSSYPDYNQLFNVTRVLCTECLLQYKHENMVVSADALILFVCAEALSLITQIAKASLKGISSRNFSLDTANL